MAGFGARLRLLMPIQLHLNEQDKEPAYGQGLRPSSQHSEPSGRLAMSVDPVAPFRRRAGNRPYIFEHAAHHFDGPPRTDAAIITSHKHPLDAFRPRDD
jgi:hypothetical protein